MRRTTALAACLALFLVVAPAFGQADLTEVVTFGDSLTHNDLLWLVYGTPPDLYRADPMEAVFNKGSGPGDRLTSYAVGGSESQHVLWQIAVYLFLDSIWLQDPGTLFSLEAGGNDVLNNAGLLAAHAPGENATADAIIDDIVLNLAIGVVALWQSNRNAQFVIWTVPDVTLTPKLWYRLSAAEAANVQAHVERANQLIRSLHALPTVIVFDFDTVLSAFVATPPVLFGQPLIPPPAFGGYDNFFADEIHPTAVSNAIMANVIIAQINYEWNDNIPGYSEVELANLAHIRR